MRSDRSTTFHQGSIRPLVPQIITIGSFTSTRRGRNVVQLFLNVGLYVEVGKKRKRRKQYFDINFSFFLFLFVVLV
jgi:hypothetical protein